MKLEEQVCSLELAKRLKELGVKQVSLFYWCPSKTHDDAWVIKYGLMPDKMAHTHEFSAFTVAELGEMLPQNIQAKKEDAGSVETGHWYLQQDKFHDHWRIYYAFGGTFVYETEGPTEADARAKMLINLIENKQHVPNQLH